VAKTFGGEFTLLYIFDKIRSGNVDYVELWNSDEDQRQITMFLFCVTNLESDMLYSHQRIAGTEYYTELTYT